MIDGFENGTAQLGDQTIAYSIGGSGPALLLLHGFPQTRAMWRQVAPALAQHFTVVAADLRGYGDSAAPEGMESYSFRAMAADQTALMAHLGYDSFHLVGHDRGARTAHRLTLDAPEAVKSLTVMDIIPTHTLLNDLQQNVARAYYHWFFLAQPAPFPENLIASDPDTYYQTALTAWGATPLDAFDPVALDHYRNAWRKPEVIHATCNDYRAAIDVDFALDAADLGREITCPALVLYGADGIMGKLYDVPATWADRLTHMQSAGLPGGHFFVDEHPAGTRQALLDFLLSDTVVRL
ncbi:alpha/beta hydrolase [Ascidiaceihabitans sp.]|uniref:alpha/beta fold hydrolase n=1 Tax=Ascidiaceihabitans sp. TaxID=1872644 RepID=UPI0032990DFC